MKKTYFIILAVFIAVAGLTPNKANAYNQDYFGEQVIYKADFEDTLIHLARNNGLGFVELRAANPTLDPWIPGAGARIVLPKKHLLPEAPRKGLVMNLAEMRIYYFKDEGKAPQTYPISIGREGLQTPTGSTSIVRKKDGPTWRPTARMRKEDPELPASVPPGPENPLGTHALYLGWPQYLIHGTNKPYGIGRRVSSGCMRMYPEDIKALFPQVPVGTPVTVVDQPVKVGWIDGDLYVEISPNQDQAKSIEENGVLPTFEITNEDMKRISAKAGEAAKDIKWDLVRRAVQEHRGYPVKILNGGNRMSDSGEEDNKAEALEKEEVAQNEQVNAPDRKEAAAKSKPAFRSAAPAIASYND